MERGCLSISGFTFTPSSLPPHGADFSHPAPYLFPNRCGKKGVSLRAMQTRCRKTLSSDWDLSSSLVSYSSSYSAAASAAASAGPWMPRMDELDTTNMLLRQRIVFLGSQVDDLTADLIISQILFLDAEDQQKDIKLFINSPGGSVTAGMGIYDAMKLCKADVSTVCLGLAASMGAFLLASGSRGKRFCMPNSRVMIHQPLGTAGGKENAYASAAGVHYTIDFRLHSIAEKITNCPF